MGSMDKSELFRVHHEWIESCLRSDRLTEWEEQFLESIKEYLEKKGSLTYKQVEVLDRIYGEKG